MFDGRWLMELNRRSVNKDGFFFVVFYTSIEHLQSSN